MSNVKNDFVLPIAVLTVICIVVSTALAFTQQTTSPIIEAAERATAESARVEVLPSADGFEELKGVVGLPDGVTEIYKATNGAGYIFMVQGKGYGGVMKGIVSMDANGTIIGTKVLSHAETAGLGSKVTEEKFQEQFPSKDASLSGVTVVGGASISSRCFIGMVSQAFDAYAIVKGA